jgi:hypothetical protein
MKFWLTVITVIAILMSVSMSERENSLGKIITASYMKIHSSRGESVVAGTQQHGQIAGLSVRQYIRYLRKTTPKTCLSGHRALNRDHKKYYSSAPNNARNQLLTKEVKLLCDY